MYKRRRSAAGAPPVHKEGLLGLVDELQHHMSCEGCKKGRKIKYLMLNCDHIYCEGCYVQGQMVHCPKCGPNSAGCEGDNKVDRRICRHLAAMKKMFQGKKMKKKEMKEKLKGKKKKKVKDANAASVEVSLAVSSHSSLGLMLFSVLGISWN